MSRSTNGVKDAWLAHLDTAKGELSKIKTAREAIDAAARAQAVGVYLKRVGASRDLHIRAAELQLMAERRLGEILIGSPKAKGEKGQFKGRDSSGGATREPPEKSTPNSVLTYAEVGLDKKRAARAQVLAGAPSDEFDTLVAKAKSAGDLSPNAVYQKIRRAIKEEAKAQAKATVPASLPPVTDRYAVYQGDLSVIGSKVADESVDYIITDPPYGKEHLSLYAELSTFASRVLKSGGSLICMTGQSFLPEVMEQLGKCMTYNWTLAYLTPGGQSAQLWGRKVNTFWKPLLWYVKDDYKGDWIGDVCRSEPNDNDKAYHHWGQSESGMADIIERFTYPGQMICDPFCGGGTAGAVSVRMNRLFIGIDSDQKAVATTLKRLAEAADA